MDIGTEVWVKSDASVWAAGVVLDCQDMAATGAVKVKLNDTAEIVTKRYLGDGDDANELFLRNKRRDFESLSCLIGLEYLHEPALLHALSERFNHDRIYTSIGDILLAVNPFKDLPLYGDHIIQQYKDTMVANMRKNGMDEQAPLPHVFAIAGKAFSGLLKREAKNQAILVSGESGSGKTESTKFLMKFLTSVGHDFSSAANAANEHQTPASTPPTSTRQKADSGDDEDEDDDVAAAGDSQEIGLRILQTNPILESFGNAQTIRNDNSSRFGKFIKIQFDAENQIVGAEIASYLLEKVRLLHQSSQERNFHIFYELLEGGDAALLSELGLERGHKYELLNAYGSTNTKATAATKRRSPFTALYSKRFKQTVQAFDDTGVEAVEREQIFQILAALLHLGNINFVMRAGGAAGSGGGGGGGPEEAATVSEKSVHHIEKCAELLGVSMDNLQSLLLTREITAGNDVVTLKLNAEQSKDASRSFAKAIYGRLFTWLVSRLSDGINYRECLAPHEQHQIKTIGILDIFGFESLEQNGFEQLCINYANERLQAQFNEFVFVKEQHIYVSEGIDWRSISYPSNAACLALFDDKANGLFSLLDQECLIPKGSNQALTSKYYRYHGGAADIAENASQPQSGQKYTLPLLVTSFGRYLNQNSSSGNDKEDEKPKASDTPFTASKMDRVNHQFVIKHFAGRVRYDIDQFLEKNQDSLPTDACQMLTTSENEIVATIGAAETFEDAPDNGGRGRARSRSRGSLLRAPSVSFQFRGQLDTLLDEIGHTEAHYVRCLKPNEDKKPGGFDRHRMVEQLRSVGVLEALRIARAGYSARLPHATFAEMFACFRSKLTAAAGVKDMNNADTCKALLAVLVDEDNLEKKRTVGPPMRTLLRASNAKFNEAVQGYGVQLGRSIVFCKTTAYNDFIGLRLRLRDKAVRTLQRICSGRFHRKRFLRMRSAALLIQRQTRRYQAILFVAGLRALRRRVAAYRIQRCMRIALLRMHEMDVKILTHRLRRMFAHFRLGCSISKSEINEVVAEQEAEEVQEKEAEKETEKEKEEPVVEKNHRQSRRVRSSSDSTEDESTDRYSGGSRRDRSVSGSDDEDRRRAKARSGGKEDKQKRHTSSRHQDHLSSEEPEREQTSEDRALRQEIERLQKMLGEQKTRSQHERKSRGSRSRVASLDAAHAAAAATRRYRTRRSSLDQSDTGDDEFTTSGGGEHESHGHQLPRRARTVMHVGRETDHVSKLTRRIEELDAKCRQLERLVARPPGGYDDRYPQIARNQGGWDRSLRRRRYSFANSDGSTGAYSDNSGYDAPSVAGGSTNAGVENLIWSIQQQMDMLRQSMVSKSEEEAVAARHDAHTMSFASSQPTRSSTVTSNSSSVHPPFDGPLHEDAETDGYPRLPSPSRTNSDPNVGGSIYGGYHHMNGAMTPPTPASEASFHMGASSRHPAYPFAPPRVVKWSRNTHCHECNEAFTLFTRRHHCRMCGQSFCHEHSSRRVTLLGMGFDDEPQRVCDACFEEYQSQPVASPDYYGGRSSMTPTSVRSAAPPYGGHPGHPGHHGPPPMFRQRSFSQQYYPPAPMHPQHNTPYGNHPPPPRYPTPYYGASPLPPHPAPPPAAAHSGMR